MFRGVPPWQGNLREVQDRLVAIVTGKNHIARPQPIHRLRPVFRGDHRARCKKAVGGDIRRIDPGLRLGFGGLFEIAPPGFQRL